MPKLAVMQDPYKDLINKYQVEPQTNHRRDTTLVPTILRQIFSKNDPSNMYPSINKPKLSPMKMQKPSSLAIEGQQSSSKKKPPQAPSNPYEGFKAKQQTTPVVHPLGD